MAWKEAAPGVNAQQQAIQLKNTFQRSQARSWRALQAEVVARFELKAHKEVFKQMRERETAQELAKRLLGKSSILEYHRSCSRNQKAAHHTKEVIQLHNDGSKGPWYWKDQSWQQLCASVDGFHVQLKDTPETMGNIVYLGRGQVLDVCMFSSTNRDDLKCEKLYFMVVTFPKVGVLDVSAMKSATKLHKDKPLQVFRFWYQRLVELGIGTREDEEFIAAQAAGGWKVCTLLFSYIRHLIHAC